MVVAVAAVAILEAVLEDVQLDQDRLEVVSVVIDRAAIEASAVVVIQEVVLELVSVAMEPPIENLSKTNSLVTDYAKSDGTVMSCNRFVKTSINHIQAL